MMTGELAKDNRQISVWLTLLVIVGGLIALLFLWQQRLPRTLPAVAVTTPLCGAWQITLVENHFSALDITSEGELWFAGTIRPSFHSGPQQLAFARWDGSNLDNLSVTVGPELPADEITITDVDVISNKEAWAVGYTNHGRLREILTVHWNGVNWSVVPTPKLPSSSQGYNRGTYVGYDSLGLFGVTAVSSNDVWAVGYYEVNEIGRTLTLHWDGSAWGLVSSPNIDNGNISYGGSNQVPIDSNYLNTVVSFSEGAVWAFGETNTNSYSNPSLAIRWDGKTWKVVEAPKLGGISAASIDKQKNIWTVNGAYNSESWMASAMKAVNVEQWAKVEMPRVEQPILSSVAAYSSDDAWAVGKWVNSNSLVVHWDGKSWREVKGLDPSNLQQLDDVVVADTGDPWIVGTSSHHEDAADNGMIAHFVTCSTALSK